MSAPSRKTSRLPAGALLAAAIVLSAGAAPSPAQGRRRVYFTTPRLREIGQNTNLYNFNLFSFGLNDRPDLTYVGPLGSGRGDVLRSNIADTGLTIRRFRSALGTPSTGIDPAPRPPSIQIPRGKASYVYSGIRTSNNYNLKRLGAPLPILPFTSGTIERTRAGTGLPALPTVGTAAGSRAAPYVPAFIAPQYGPGIGAALARQDETALGATGANLRALEAALVSQLSDANRPITTLVPDIPSPYRDHMAKADQAFRAGNFHGALIEFQIANDLGNQDPESFLCLAHTQFAISHHSYAMASYYLQRALKKFPKLPLTNLRPEGFYGSAARYAENIVALREHLERDATDSDALLMLAYFRWFGKVRDAQAARKALSQAIGHAVRRGQADLAEAIETFWAGMVATGAVSGPLKPEAPPAAVSAPPAGKAS